MSNYTDDLKKSPIFALTLGSKELTHSNFWKWLIDLEITKNHPYVEIFIEDFYSKGYKFEKVEREEGNRDITIYYSDSSDNKYCHVVENKIKVLPTEEQLNRYYNDVSKKFPNTFSGTLTGIEVTLDIPSKWCFISYNEIAKNIEYIKYKHPSSYDNYIQEYISVIRNISAAITKEIEKNDARNSRVNDAPTDLIDVRLDDVFLKLCGSIEADFYIKKIGTYKLQLITRWGVPIVEQSFNNKKTTISIIYTQKDPNNNNNEIGRIGVQLEGDQFRVYGGPSTKGSKLKDKDELFDKFCKIEWLDKDFNYKTNRKIFGKDTNMQGGKGGKKYCKYETDNYTHIYQYWNIVKKNYEYEQIWNEIYTQLKKASILIDSTKINFTKEQYDTSYNGLKEKMGITDEEISRILPQNKEKI